MRAGLSSAPTLEAPPAAARRPAARLLLRAFPAGWPALTWPPAAAPCPAVSPSGPRLARALLADPEVLVLVEPTSAVDGAH